MTWYEIKNNYLLFFSFHPRFVLTISLIKCHSLNRDEEFHLKICVGVYQLKFIRNGWQFYENFAVGWLFYRFKFIYLTVIGLCSGILLLKGMPFVFVWKLAYHWVCSIGYLLFRFLNDTSPYRYQVTTCFLRLLLDVLCSWIKKYPPLTNTDKSLVISLYSYFKMSATSISNFFEIGPFF